MENSQDAAIGESFLEIVALKARVRRLEAMIRVDALCYSLESIIEAASRASGHSVAMLKGPRRTANIIKWRFAAIAIMEKQTLIDYTTIGAFMSGRDNKTVAHAVNAVEDRPERFAAYVYQISRELLKAEPEL